MSDIDSSIKQCCSGVSVLLASMVILVLDIELPAIAASLLLYIMRKNTFTARVVWAALVSSLETALLNCDGSSK